MPESDKRVAVIGAGYTGLVAALRLATGGTSVTIIENGSYLGGLASGFTIGGEPIEKAYHHLFRTDREILDLVDELGISDKLEWLVAEDALYYQGKMYPFSSPWHLLRFTPLAFHNRIRTGVVALYLQFNKHWGKYKSVTALEWMTRAVGKQATEVIWEPLLRGKFDHYYDKVAMAWLWARIHVRSNSKDRGDLVEKLGYFSGGFQTVTNALERQLRSLGVEIRLGVAVSRIEANNGRTLLTYADGAQGEFDATIATIPSGAFARIISDTNEISADFRERLVSTPYLGARIMIFSSDQEISPYYWHNINDVELPFLVFINHTRLTGTARYGGKFVYYVATYASHESEIFTCADEVLTETWFAGVSQVFPHFDPSQIIEKFVFRFRNAQHIVGTDYDLRVPPFDTGMPGLFLSNFSQIYPEDRGTNYAVRDGTAIARQTSEYLKHA